MHGSGGEVSRRHVVGRRAVLRGALATAGILGFGAALPSKAGQRGAGGGGADATLALARFLNRTTYRDLPPRAIEHAKMILASTFASAAAGSHLESAKILRDLAKEQGGRAEATIWFDGERLPAPAAARVNAGLSDAAASDDSDLRNTAHEGTAITAAGLAVGERTGASGRDLLLAMVLGYEAAGRIGEAREGGVAGLHASQLVAFAGAATAARLLTLTDEQLAHAIGIVATTGHRGVGGRLTGLGLLDRRAGTPRRGAPATARQTRVPWPTSGDPGGSTSAASPTTSWR